MPYQNRRPRRTTYRRRYYPARKPVAKSKADEAYALAQQAWKAGKFLKGIINSEKKYRDLSFSNDPTDTVPTANLINDVPTGDLGNQRDGMSIRIKSLSIKGDIFMDPSATATIVRLMVVQWYNNIDLRTPVMGDVLESLGLHQHYLKDNIGSFKVLYDRNFTVCTNNPVKEFRIWLPLNMITRWELTDTTGDEGAMLKNGLFFFTLSSETTNTPNIAITSRILFYDN